MGVRTGGEDWLVMGELEGVGMVGKEWLLWCEEMEGESLNGCELCMQDRWGAWKSMEEEKG